MYQKQASIKERAKEGVKNLKNITTYRKSYLYGAN
jgi:hypothetical protein